MSKVEALEVFAIDGEHAPLGLARNRSMASSSTRADSDHLLPMWRLSGKQECFHQLTLAADDHAREAFEPFACGDFGVRVAPRTKQAHLIEADFALPGAERQMLDQRARQLLAAQLWHDCYSSP